MKRRPARLGRSAATGNLASFEHPLIPVIVTAVMAVAALIAVHVH